MLSLKKDPDLPYVISAKCLTKKERRVSFRVNEVHNYIQADALELSTEYLLDPRTIQ
jgi:hypothetical protein